MPYYRLLPALLGCVLLGLVLGVTPVVQDNTRFYGAEIIPLSGFLFGMLGAALQFRIAKRLHAPVVGRGVRFLAVGCMVGYLSIDFGRYLTATAMVREPRGGVVQRRVAESLTFGQFVWSGLEATWVEQPHGRGIARRFNRTQSTVLYLIDLALCLGMGAFCASQLASKCSYCRACGRYEIMTTVAVIPTTSDRSLRKPLLEEVEATCTKGDEQSVIELFVEIGKKSVPAGSHQARLILERWNCEECGRTSSRVTYQVLGGSAWVTNGVYEVKPGSTAGADPSRAVPESSG